MSATILGTNAAIYQGITRRWTKKDGTTVVHTWRGPDAKITAKFDGLVAQDGGTDPQYQSLEEQILNGRATLVGTYVDTSMLSDPNQVPTVYELYHNTFNRPVQQAPYFAYATEDGAALSADDIADVFTTYDDGTDPTTSGFTGKKLALLTLLWQGTTDYMASGFVLRRTMTVQNDGTIEASYSNINRVEAPPDVSAINAIIGNLPTEQAGYGVIEEIGEWLKMAPDVRTVGSSGKYEIIQEWWWAPKWSAVLYGGTGTP